MDILNFDNTYVTVDLDAIAANFQAVQEKAGVPVIPIAVKTDCEPTRPDGKGWLKDFGTVDTSKEIRLRCGPPISGTAKEMHQKVFDWIKAQLEEWGLPTEG